MATLTEYHVSFFPQMSALYNIRIRLNIILPEMFTIVMDTVSIFCFKML